MRRRWWILGLFVALLSGGPATAGAQEEGEPAEEETEDGAEAEEEAQDAEDDEEVEAFSSRIRGEFGFLAPLWHRIQFGRGNTYFNFIEDGGQDVLFPFQRMAVEFEFVERHQVVLLYQPLRLESRVTLAERVAIEDTVFPAGTPVDIVYGFPFYRASYLYDFAPAEEREIAAGASLQLRNATIIFSSVDGNLREANRDLGPVPILKFRARVPGPGKYWYGAEVDGFYAPISYLNGDAESDAEGAIVDASLRAGRPLSSDIEAYLNLRYLAGGSSGVNPEDIDDGSDGFTRNWLHFFTVSLGFSWYPG